MIKRETGFTQASRIIKQIIKWLSLSLLLTVVIFAVIFKIQSDERNYDILLNSRFQKISNLGINYKKGFEIWLIYYSEDELVTFEQLYPF